MIIDHDVCDDIAGDADDHNDDCEVDDDDGVGASDDDGGEQCDGDGRDIDDICMYSCRLTTCNDSFQ